jgi:hypothetical protein
MSVPVILPCAVASADKARYQAIIEKKWPRYFEGRCLQQAICKLIGNAVSKFWRRPPVYF